MPRPARPPAQCQPPHGLCPVRSGAGSAAGAGPCSSPCSAAATTAQGGHNTAPQGHSTPNPDPHLLCLTSTLGSLPRRHGTAWCCTAQPFPDPGSLGTVQGTWPSACPLTPAPLWQHRGKDASRGAASCQGVPCPGLRAMPPMAGAAQPAEGQRQPLHPAELSQPGSSGACAGCQGDLLGQDLLLPDKPAGGTSSRSRGAARLLLPPANRKPHTGATFGCTTLQAPPARSCSGTGGI